jgi:outer membrane receptor protein involved in Fe transport
MRVQSVVPWIAVVGTLTSWSARAAGQQLTVAAWTPRFLYASSTAGRPVEIDVSHSAMLGRVVSLHVERATIGGLLAEVQRQTGLTFAYDRHFPMTRPVTLEAESITVAAALGAILVGTGVDVVLTPTGHVWLTESNPGTSRVQEGTIVGRVTEKQTGDPLVGATVTLEPARQSAITDSDGHYRFANLNPGNYTVRARYIGYRALVASATVGVDQEVILDFSLEKSAQQLDEVVTTGTVVPTEVKALPSPVSVIRESDIELQRPHNVQELFRQAVPTAVSFDRANNPYYTAFSVRGASTLTPDVGQMKVFVDGVEAAFPSVAGVDPATIERVEVVRGPQAAAIYGSDAIGGVIQVFTKRGDPNVTRPQVGAEAALGVVQTPYAGINGVVRQKYGASMRGGAADMSYNLGGSYSRTGDWLPNGEESAQSNPSVYGGMRFARGMITVDLSGRYYVNNTPIVANPDLSQTGFFLYSKPFFRPQQYQNQTVGARFSVAPTRWWLHTVTAGIDRFTQDLTQSRRRLTSPSDTLLWVINLSQTKTSVGYNTTLTTALGSGMSGSLVVGVDHYSMPVSSFGAFGALNTTGSIRTAFPPFINRMIVNNTGYFGQAQLGLGNRLFLTGGARAEKNTNFGDSLGTPVSPRVGLSYVQSIGTANLKLRSSWGRALRAPDPGMKIAGLFGRIANPQLGPERQHGWDVGVDATFSGRGSLSVTYYNQTADNLIQFAQLQATPEVITQFQNLGRVKNTGIEAEATLFLGPVQVKGQYGYARARVDQLAATYTGDLQVGDQALLTPKHTAGASAAIAPFARTTISAGLTYVGSYNNYDSFAQARCAGGTGPCQAAFRDYIVAYPSFAKANATITQQITPLWSGVVSVDNLTNNMAYEGDNSAPVMGRVTTVAVRFQY